MKTRSYPSISPQNLWWPDIESMSLCLCELEVSAWCPKDCRCPPGTPRCAAGVRFALDGCGCCKVCPRQLFEDCNQTLPCDRTRGLECNFGGGSSSAQGICRAKADGRTCEYGNGIHQNGEIFRPNCKHQCTCMDGAVGCVSLCPHQLALPKPGCAEPERVKVRSRCCEPLARTRSSAKRKRGKAPGRDKLSEGDLANGGDLAPAGGDESNYILGGVKCVSRTTAWSPCSKSCGTGVSTRATNTNGRCQLAKETRVCEVRPCKMNNTKLKQKGRQCNQLEEASRPVRLSHAGCRSLIKFRPRYCGSCVDGRCCEPHRTQTLPVRFRCERGALLARMVMVIQSCRCDRNCSGYGLYNDNNKAF
ncbi:CCN family member 1-like isoform X3 [Pungitius pungitius]|uniref:CCN family member 1-like isoform X3 n=1 Tax=Pungitius pungitius TaxID=134920 RepID=UPI002E117882